VDPDLSAWSKAIANGRALAAVLGNDAFRGGAKNVFVTGSFWFAAVPMAAAIATINALKQENAIEAMHRMGSQLRDGIMDQARSWDLAVNYTGPPVMPYLTFAGDQDHELAGVFAAQALRGGAYLHPRHNWFVSAAMTGDDLALALEATDQAFAAVRKHLGQLAGGPPCPVQQPNPTRPRPPLSRPGRPIRPRRSSSGPATSRSYGGRSGSSRCSRSPSRSSRSPRASS
jgi:glutamate-1-semialdehyde 2,1-aminomutase